MSTVLLAQSAPVIDRVTQAASGQVAALSGAQASDPQMISQVVTEATELLLVEVSGDPGEALSIAQWASERFGTPVVFISDDAGLGIHAMRAGVRDMVSPASEVGEFHEAITRNRRVHVAVPDGGRRRGRIVTIASPKGGVGKTTVTTNVAVGLALASQEPVVLVDLDIHFGDVASALNLEPDYTLPDAARAASGGDPLAVKPYLARHETGLWVVAGSDNPVAADAVTAQDAAMLLRTLAEDFAYVVVDTSPGLSEHTLAALDLTSDLILVTGLDVPGVRGLRKEIETLRELSMLVESRQVVLNFADPSRGLSVADVEATIRSKVDVALPTANLVPISVNQGIPLLQSRGRDRLTRELQALVDRLVGEQPQAEPRGLFGRRKAAR